MANIRDTILSRYDIDLEKEENILKLYKLDKLEKAEPSSEEVQAQIDAARKRWNQSINSANEKNAARDRARLEKADKYEAILRDAKLYKELRQYYGSGKNGGASGEGSGTAEFAKEYFKLVSTTKKLRKKDVDFFFAYFPEERKNKKAILAMLSKDFKLKVLDKGEKEPEEDTEAEGSGGKKKKEDVLIVNLFRENTILNLQKCIDYYKESAGNEEIVKKYPELLDGMYEFLEMDKMESVGQFSEALSLKQKEVYEVRQEKGTAFVVLLNMLNKLQDLTENKDVADNFAEFKLLIRYPKLTPYMYAFVEMKPDTMKGLISIADRDYAFRDEADFILNYYNVIYSNFGISNTGISRILRNAEKKAKANKILNGIDEKLGWNKKRKVSLGASVIHWLLYWPIFVLYFVFELSKAIFTELHKFTIPVFVILFVISNVVFPEIFYVDNLLIFRNIFKKELWLSYLEYFYRAPVKGGFTYIVLTFYLMVRYAIVYVFPALLTAQFVHSFSVYLNNRYDWTGLERTFGSIIGTFRKKTENEYRTEGKAFYKNKVSKVLANFVCFALLLAVSIVLIKVGGSFVQEHIK